MNCILGVVFFIMGRLIVFLAAVMVSMMMCHASVLGPEAQDRWRQIVGDSNYLWGHGTGESRESSRQAALADLIQKQSVAIHVDISTDVIETQRNGSWEIEDTTMVTIRTYAAARLSGLDFLDANESGSWHSIAFISRSNYQRSIEHRKHEIRDHVRIARRAETECRIKDALKHLYWAWLLSTSCADTVIVEVDESRPLLARTALLDKLGQVASSISVDCRRVYRDDDVILADLAFTYHGRPIRNLHFSYYSGKDMDYDKVHNGKAEIPIYDEPIRDSRQLVLRLEIAAEGEMLLDSELWALHQLMGSQLPHHTVQVDLAFPWLQSPDVVAKSEKPRFPSVILDLLSLETTDDFMRNLGYYRTLGMLGFGRNPSVSSTVRNFVAVFDEARMISMFEFNGRIYEEVGGERTLSELGVEFKGRRVIWIHTMVEGDGQ